MHGGRFRNIALVVALAGWGVACSGDKGSGGAGGAGTASGTAQIAKLPPGRGDGGSAEVTTQFAPDLGVDLGFMARVGSGLYLRDLQPGTGDRAKAGELVTLQYTAWLPNGVRIETSRESGKSPMEFVLGTDQQIAGLTEGVNGMQVGGRRMLVVPPSLAYGDRGVPGIIPPNSTLVFDLELVAVK